jgi:uncharacterized cupin superfamily protein
MAFLYLISPAMPKLQLDTIAAQSGSSYPSPFDQPVAGRVWQRLGDAGGLTQFGVNLVHMQPGQWSSQRHWHSHEDEFVYVVAGELILVTDAGEQAMGPGDCAAFPAGVANGHHLLNRSGTVATFLAVGSRFAQDRCVYPDIDLLLEPDADTYVHRDGSAYPGK